MKRFIVLIICLFIILLGITQCEHLTKSAATLIIKETEKRRELPQVGTYVCEECGMQISFFDQEITLLSADGECELVNIDYGNNLIGRTSGLIALIYWDQKKDQIELEIKRGNNYFTTNTEHHLRQL